MIDLNQLFDLLQEPSSAPIRLRLRNALVGQLSDGTFKPGDVFPSESVLQNKLKIGLDIIHEVIQGLIDTKLIERTPNGEMYALGKPEVAAALPVQTSQVVGLIAAQSIFHIYYGQMAGTFNRTLQKAGWTAEMALYNEQIDSLYEIVEQMLQHNVRAFSINPPAEANIRPLLEDLHARGIPIQLVGRGTNYSDCDFIGVDNKQIGYLATRHLIELGHTRIIYVGGANYSTNCDRASGYVKAMSADGLLPRIFNVHAHRPFPVLPEFQRYLDPENTPTALWREMVRHRVTAAFCFNYDDATWLYNEIRKFNLVVPRDISIITVDNPPAGGYMTSLTTFALPGDEMGRQAAGLLLRRLAGEDFPPQKIELPGDLILNSSTAAPRERRTIQG
jgi:DNA-binding LacI/PurR family transcriptional regulator